MNGLVRFSARAIAAACTLLLIGSTALRAQTAPSTSNHSTTTQSASTLSPSMVGQSGLEFLENKGQVVDDQGRKVESVRFTAVSQGAKLFLMPDRIVHQFISIEGPGATHKPGKGVSSKELDQTITRIERIDMELVGARTKDIRPEGLLPGVTNFFTASAGPEGITGVRSFSTVVYENVYPNIDLVLKARGKGMKAEYIVRPGGDPRSIRLRITGAQGLERTPDGGYRIRTALGTITEDAPYSFIRTADGSEQEVAVRFRIEGDEIAFDVPEYDQSQTLVIDPGRDWGTFHGGNTTDVGTGIAVRRSFDPSSSTPYIYICGYTASNLPIVGTLGQTSYGGGAFDAFVAAYQYGGTRQYSYYFGGAGDDRAYGITADGSGQIWIVGQTRSAGLPTFTNTFNTSGDIDAFVARFSSSGVIQAGRYVGGNNDDYFLAVAYDGTNLTCGGYTASTGLATGAAIYQSTYNGLYCGMIARLPATALSSPTWLTYYGNNTGSPNGQETYVTSLSPHLTNGGVWVGGYTNSPNTGDAIATNGSFNTVVNNNGSNTTTGAVNFDGFVALMNSSGGRTASTYYGAVQNDRVLGVAADPLDANAVIAVGRTNSINAGNLIAGASGSNTVFNTILNNGTNLTSSDDGFVTRLTVSGNTLQRDWGSYWGSTQDDYLTSVAVDDNNVSEAGSNTISDGRGGKIFVAGLTAGSSGNFGSYNFNQIGFTSNQGGYDAVWSRIRRAPNGSPEVEYSVITGGLGNDIANGIAVDNQRNVHIVGTASPPGPTHNITGGSGAAQTGYGGGASDAFAVKWCNLIVPNAPELSTNNGGSWGASAAVCQTLNGTATGFVTTPGSYPNVQSGTTSGSCPLSAVQTLWVRLTNAVQGVQYRLSRTTLGTNYLDISPISGASSVNTTTVVATQDGEIRVNVTNLPVAGTYDLRWEAYTQAVGSSCSENGVTGVNALTIHAMPANDAISQGPLPGTDINSAATPGSTFNFYACGGSSNNFTVATAGLTYNWCVMQNGTVTTAPSVTNFTTQTVTITPNTGAGQRDTLYLRVRLTNANGCAIEYQAALYVLPVVSIQNGLANEAFNANANPQNLCVSNGGTVVAPSPHSYQDSGPHSLVNTYGNATIPGNGATGSDGVTTPITQNYQWTTNTPIGTSISSVTFTNPTSANGGPVSVTFGPTPLNPTTVQFTLTESYSGSGINGCSRFSTYNVDIYPQPTVTVTAPPGPVCEGTNVQFQITVTPSSITSGTFSVTLNAGSQTGATFITASNATITSSSGNTYTGNFSSSNFSLTFDPGTVNSAYDALGSISLTVNSLTNGTAPVSLSCGITSAVTSLPVMITQNPDPISSYQQARANTANTPTYGIGNPQGNLVPPTTSQTGTSFQACLYDAANGFGQEYTYTIVSPSPSSPPNGNDSYTWTIPGTPGIDYTLVSGGGTQFGSAPPSATIRWLTPGSRIITITQVNNQPPGTCQTVNNFVVNVNNLPSSPANINWQQANWCENSTVSFTYTVPALATAAFPIQVQFYGENVDAFGPGGPVYTPAPMAAITQTFTAAQAGTTVGPFSFTAGDITGGAPPTWVDISIAVSIVDANGCGRWGPAGVGQPFRSVSTRIWDTPVEPQVGDWAFNPGPFGDGIPAIDIVCPNKQTDPNALVPATGMIYPDDFSLGNPNDGWYNYQIANLSDYPVGTTFNWQILDNSSNLLTPGTDYDIQFSSTGGYNNNRVQIRWGKHLDGPVSPLTFDISVTFPSSSGGCTLPFGSPFHPTASVTISPEPNPNITGADPNGTLSLSPPGLCSGNTAQYDCGVSGAPYYQWSIVESGASGTSPLWNPLPSPSFVGPNNTQVVTIDWPAFSDEPLRWPRIDVVVQDPVTLCYEGDTATAYILPVPDATPIMVGPEGPCVFNSENSHIKAFTVPKSTNYTIASVTWTLTNGFGAVYSYSTTDAPFTLPNANDTVRYQFYSTGNETITATVTTTNGCSATGSLNFTIYPPPSPVISGPASICHNQTGTYTATPFISGDAYTWEIIPSSGGTITSGQGTTVVQIQWTGSPNTYQIRLTQVSAQGCTARVYYGVAVNPLPTPQVSGPSTICANQNYTYTTQNNAPASSYVWSILAPNTAGASIVSGQNTATVTVSATTSNASFDLSVTETIIATSCSASDTKTNITVVASPTPSISRTSPSGPLGQACVGQTITYLTPSVSGHTYQWSVTGGGSIVGASTNNTVQIAWSATGSQTITLTETIGNCSVTVTQTVNVVPQPTPVVSGPSVACSGSGNSYTYSTANNAGSTYSWSLGAGVSAIGPTTNASVTVTFSNSTLNSVNRTLSVTETNSANCSATSATMNVSVTSTPQPSITGTTPVCQNTSATYSDANAASEPPATTYNWSVTGGTITGAATNSSVTVLWTGTGSQTVTLVATNNTNSANCQATATYNVVVNPAPTAYNVTTSTPSICVGGGPVTINLSGSQTGGASYQLRRNGSNIGLPVSGTGGPLQFTDSGPFSSAATHNYDVVATLGSCTAVMNGTATVVVNPLPTPSVTGPTSVCSGQSYQYSTPNASPRSWTWTVPTGWSITNGQGTPQITVTAGTSGGTVSVLETNTSTGCSATSSLSVSVTAPPTVYNVSPTTASVCRPNSGTTTFNVQLSGSQLNVNYQVMLGSTPIGSAVAGTGSSINLPITIGTGGNITSTGTYTLTVQATATSGACSGVPTMMSGSVTLTVNPTPSPTVNGPTTVCSGQSYTYQTTNNSGSTYNWSVPTGWTITSGQGTSQINVTSGTTGGNITVTETVSSTGCSATSPALAVTVTTTPSPAITGPASPCAGTTQTYTTSAGFTSYSWSISPATAGTIQSGGTTNSATIQWGNNAVSATVTVTVANGACTGQGSLAVNVQAAPTVYNVGTTTPTACSNVSNNVTITLSGSQTNVTYTISRSPGGVQATLSGNGSPLSFTQSVATAGTYGYTISATNGAGCTSVMNGTATVVVTDPPTASISGGPTAVCSGTTATYAASPASGVTYAWSVSGSGNSVQSTTANQATILFGMTSGTATVSVTVTDGNGCTGSANQSVTVHALPLNRPVSISPSAICAAGGVGTNVTSATITVGSTAQPVDSNTTYQLLQGSSVVATQATGATPPDTITFTVGSLSAGTYVYSVRAISSTTPACTTVMTQTATLVVNPLPTPAVTGNTTPCVGQTVTYATQNNTGSTYAWTWSADFTASGPINTYQITGTWGAAGSKTITVTETNSNNCGQSNTLSVTVSAQIAATVSGPSPLCSGSSATYTATPTSGVTYAWSVSGAGNSVQSTTANQATILFGMSSGNATVTVVVTNSNGCQGTATQSVTVHALPSDRPVSISPSAICAAGGVGTNVTSATITVGSTAQPVDSNTTYQLLQGSSVVATQATGATPPDTITFTVGSLSAGTYVYSVRAISSTTPACTTVMTQTATLVVNPLPTPAVTGPTSPCQGTAVTYVTTNNTGSTYSWQTSGATFNLSGPNNTYQLNGTWTGTGSGTVTVTETNSNGCGQTNSLSVNVQPAPTPTITASQLNPICGGQTVTFTATPSGATSYTWTVGSNGTLQSGQGTSSIVVTWANVPSSYSSSVSVVVNVGGCTGSANYTVNVNPQATPTISGPATICSGQSGTYSTPLTTGRTYSWSTTSTPPGMTPFSQSGTNLNSVTINWVNTSSSPFVATVQVVESAGGVCTGTATYNVTVNPLPSTAITGPTSVCQGQTVTYSHSPALTGHSFAWTVTNAQSWSGQGTGAITVTWGNTNGTVALTVTNNGTGCTNTATNSPLAVTVNPNPTPTISGNVNPCAGSTQTYSTQTGMTSYSWSITPASAGTIIGQNDQSSVSIQWSNTQVTATLTVQVNNSGCTGQQSITINVQPKPTPAISGVAQTCPGVDRTYTTPYTAGNTYSWTISYTPGYIITGGSTTSNTVTVRFNSPGASSQTATLQVTETSPYGCQGTATQTVTVQPAPQPVISGNTNVCGYLAQYDGMPINNTETYVVSDANGINYATANIVWTLPFGGGTFTGASSGTGVTTVTVQWDEPTAAATVGRQIAAQVTLGAPTNCTGQTTSNVQVNWNPKPSISGPRAWCDNSVYTANSTSASQSGLATYSVQVPVTPVLPSGSSRTYNWTITPASAGTVVSGQGTPTVQVSWTSGLANTPVNAVLSVTETINYLNNSATPTNKFCGITDTFRVVINPIPKPVITSPNNGIAGPNGQGPCGRDTYTYQVAADANSSYQWVVSGGSIIGASTGNSINVQWNNVTSPTQGYVGVTQTFLTPATMCSTYVQQNLTIQVKPSPKVTGPTVLCQQTNNGTNVGNYTVQTVVPFNTYQWFAEPASLVISTVTSGPLNENFQVTWGGTSSTPLTARVIVLETNPFTGCSERDTLTVTLNPNPTPVITSTTGGLNPNGVCAGSTHIYQTQFNTGNSYLWTVTGGTISGAATNNQVTVVWGSAGAGTITVREQVGAMFGSGCWTQVTANVTIQPLPNPVITGPATVCRYTQQSYTVQTPNANNTYQWTVTNGSIQGSSSNPTVTVLWYDVPTGTIAVTETTPPSQGSCSNTASVNVTINPKPAPVISGPPAPPVCVNSTQTYSTPLVTGNTYLWTVTGGTIGGAATNNTVTVTWTTVGNGTISVKQTNTVGCDTTVSRTIPVNALPSVTITPSGPTTICNGQSVTLLATPGFVSYSWNTGETTPNITVTQSGTYVVTVVDNNGCSNNSNSITVTVQNVTAPQIQASGPTTFCQGQSVTLSITGTNIQGYAWSNGATTSSITVTTSGSYWCEVTYNNGCKARTEIIQVTVVPRPTVSITANGPTSFCEGGSVVLSAGAGFATYAWSNGTQTVGTSSTLTVTQAGTYTVTVTNNIGCSATSQPVVVTVYPKPTPQIQASGPTEFCEGGSVTLDGGAGFASYQWSNGATTRTITVTQQGSYTVTVTDQNNCSGTSQPVVVTVYPKPPKPTITQTGGTLTSSSAAQYQWYYNSQPISGATNRSYTLVRGRDQSGYYKVSIRDNNGCENTSDSIYIDITPVEVAGDNTGIQFMPNPTSGELRIVFGDAIGAEHARVIVRNLVGRELLSVELGAISAGSSKTIDLANLPNGMYMVEVILPSGMRTIGRVTKVD